MESSVLNFLKAEWKVSDTGSAHWASSLIHTHFSTFSNFMFRQRENKINKSYNRHDNQHHRGVFDIYVNKQRYYLPWNNFVLFASQFTPQYQNNKNVKYSKLRQAQWLHFSQLSPSSVTISQHHHRMEFTFTTHTLF